MALVSTFVDRRVSFFHYRSDNIPMDVKLILLIITPLFTLGCLYFGTRNGFYDTDKYHGNGSAH